jgi:hypothetical protein
MSPTCCTDAGLILGTVVSLAANVAGGMRGLEAYQSGILISGEGHVLTVWSYVLDADDVTVVCGTTGAAITRA